VNKWNIDEYKKENHILIINGLIKIKQGCKWYIIKLIDCNRRLNRLRDFEVHCSFFFYRVFTNKYVIYIYLK
jgi:hypothetical protein